MRLTSPVMAMHARSGAVRAGKGPYSLLGAVVEQTHFDVTIGQCDVSHGNLACAILLRRKTFCDGEFSSQRLLPQQLYRLSYCHTKVPNSGSGPSEAHGAIILFTPTLRVSVASKQTLLANRKLKVSIRKSHRTHVAVEGDCDVVSQESDVVFHSYTVVMFVDNDVRYLVGLLVDVEVLQLVLLVLTDEQVDAGLVWAVERQQIDKICSAKSCTTRTRGQETSETEEKEKIIIREQVAEQNYVSQQLLDIAKKS